LRANLVKIIAIELLDYKRLNRVVSVFISVYQEKIKLCTLIRDDQQVQQRHLGAPPIDQHDQIPQAKYSVATLSLDVG